MRQILSLKRGHASVGEELLIQNYLAPYHPQVFVDRRGNPAAFAICTDPAATTLFCCHIDTVHHQWDDPHQEVHYDRQANVLCKQDGEPLGADDGAGVWLLLEMIDQDVSGTYLFHRCEEAGCEGSRAMADQYPGYLSRFACAIAFDRRGTNSVITHQRYVRCCSDAFAKQLAEQLSDNRYCLEPDSTGIATDTAEYVKLIPECTNVSVGYDNAHSGKETLDLDYLDWLRGRMLQLRLTLP